MGPLALLCLAYGTAGPIPVSQRITNRRRNMTYYLLDTAPNGQEQILRYGEDEMAAGA